MSRFNWVLVWFVILALFLSLAVGDDDDGPSGGGTDSSACVWQFRAEDSIVNGQYLLAGEENGHYYYSKKVPTTDNDACGESVVHLFFSDDKWRIGPDLGDDSTMLAFCDTSQILDSPFDCDITWSVDGEFDRNAEVTAGACPDLPCDSIVFTYADDQDPNECPGTYTASKFGPNTYEKAGQIDGTVYFYFNPLRFRWQCGYSIDADCSATTVDEASETGYRNMSDLEWEHYPGSTANGDFYINCLVD